jgi:crotonobetainyl-CoA:carnitine CoA-transferase CaiB-like acyl-CoA transferase
VPAARAAPVDGPLSGVRVLDLADRSGAYAGRLLAALGADVLLAEPPGGHDTRRLDGDGLGFTFYACGKSVLPIDRDTKAGRAQIDRLAAAADAVVDTGHPGVADDLHARYPRLIVASITPFGRSGPRRTWLATDTVAQARGGMLGLSGHPGAPPLRALGLQAYQQAGVLAAAGVVAALLAREAGAPGRLLDVSLQAAVTASLEHLPGLFHQHGLSPRRQGTLHWTRAFRAGRCRDGWVLHSTMGDWTTLVEWVKSDGASHGLDDPAWSDPERRREDAERIFDALDAWGARHETAELYEGAQLRRLPYAALRPARTLPDDPQLHARRFFAPIDTEAGGSVPIPGLPFLLGGTRPRTRPPAPLGTTERWDEPRRDDGRGGAAPAHPPLADVCVLDFTRVVAGPVATRLLADLGARVVKVERPGATDFGERRGGLTGSLMRGKESVVLDLRSAAGLALARRLALASDVVIDNFSARVMPQLGLDWTTLSRTRPDLVSVRMTGFGLTGPHRHHVSYGPTLQALAGYTLGMAHPGGPPAGFGYSYADLASGHMAALATLAALRRRRRTGAGMEVDLSQFEVAAGLVGPWTPSGDAPLGNASPEGEAAPHGVYPCVDDDTWVAVTVMDDAQWQGLVRVVGAPAGADADLATTAGRVRRRGDLDAWLAQWTSGHQAEEVEARLQDAGVPAGIVAGAQDVCRRDPQLAARDHFVDVTTPAGDTVRLDGPPFPPDDGFARVRGPGPLLGEHTRAVLAQILGLAPDELDALEASGAIATASGQGVRR